MMPYWAVVIIIVVIVVAYFLLSNTAKERRRGKVAADFTGVPNFHANQVFIDARGDVALGIDDRGRRLAVARKFGQPRTRVYSFAHVLSAEVLQDEKTIATVSKGGAPNARGGQQAAADSLFGSTQRQVVGLPVVKPALGMMTALAVRISLEGSADPVLIRFYRGKSIAPESIPAEKAFAQARACLGALDVAIKRGPLPPRPAISGTGLGPR